MSKHKYPTEEPPIIEVVVKVQDQRNGLFHLWVPGDDEPRVSPAEPTMDNGPEFGNGPEWTVEAIIDAAVAKERQGGA